MQLIAMLTMLIDHTGKVFFEDQWIWRVIGRLAFPIYAYCIVIGYRNTRSVKIYMLRLFFIAIISQIPYMLALNIDGVNVVATLLVCVMVLYFMEKLDVFLWLPLTIILALMMDVLHFDYGIHGLLLVIIYHFAPKRHWVFYHLALNLALLLNGYWIIGMASVVATVILVYFPRIFSVWDRYKVPRWVWRSFYPLHLAVIALIININ